MKLPFPLFAVLGFFALSTSGFADSGTQTRQQMEKAVGGQQLHYWLYLPDGSNKVAKGSIPLVLFLHGAGERGANIDRVKVHGPPKLVGKGSPLDGAIVISPQCPANSWWKTETLKALLDEVITAHPEVDLTRLYVTGLSMGGYGSWGLLAEYPDLFAAAVPICGGGDINRRRKGKDKRPSSFSLDNLRRAKDVPIWAFHGGEDFIVPPAESILLVDALKEAGSKSVQLTIYEGVNHDSWTRTYDDPEVWKWLFEQKKG